MDNAQYQSPSWDFRIPHDALVAASSSNNKIQHVLLDMIKEMHTIPKDPANSVLTQLTLTPWDQCEETEKESAIKLGQDATFLVKSQWDPMIIK